MQVSFSNTPRYGQTISAFAKFQRGCSDTVIPQVSFLQGEQARARALSSRKCWITVVCGQIDENAHFLRDNAACLTVSNFNHKSPRVKINASFLLSFQDRARDEWNVRRVPRTTRRKRRGPGRPSAPNNWPGLSENSRRIDIWQREEGSSSRGTWVWMRRRSRSGFRISGRR